MGAVRPLGAGWPQKTCIFRGLGAAVNHHSVAASLYPKFPGEAGNFWNNPRISSIPGLSQLITSTLHIHIIILISAHWSANSLSFFTGQVSPLYNILCSQISVQPPSHKKADVLIGKHRHTLPTFIPSLSYSSLHSCISISIYAQHVTQVTELIH